jgi:hypothetical protein
MTTSKHNASQTALPAKVEKRASKHRAPFPPHLGWEVEQLESAPTPHIRKPHLGCEVRNVEPLLRYPGLLHLD